MTLKECYVTMHGSYEDARQRLMNDRLVEKFMLKFLDDKSMENLRNAVKGQNLEEAFRAAHTLKGVAANLAFTELQEAASELTEYYRKADLFMETPRYDQVVKAHRLVIDTIEQYKNEKE